MKKGHVSLWSLVGNMDNIQISLKDDGLPNSIQINQFKGAFISIGLYKRKSTCCVMNYSNNNTHWKVSCI